MSVERITVNNLTASSELAALAANEAVTLDVTNLDLGRLPVHVKAALYTEATTFSAPQLQTAEDIYAANATEFSVPQLRTSGHIDAYSATEFSAPRLQVARDIDASNATSFSAPQLQVARDIDASNAASFSAPQLQTAEDIYAPRIAGRPPVRQRVRSALDL